MVLPILASFIINEYLPLIKTELLIGFPSDQIFIYTADFIFVACFYNAGGGKVLFYCGNLFHNHHSFGLNLDFQNSTTCLGLVFQPFPLFWCVCKIVTFVFSCWNVFVFFHLITGTVLLLGRVNGKKVLKHFVNSPT